MEFEGCINGADNLPERGPRLKAKGFAEAGPSGEGVGASSEPAHGGEQSPGWSGLRLTEQSLMDASSSGPQVPFLHSGKTPKHAPDSG
jgi:hypothetical protein